MSNPFFDPALIQVALAGITASPFAFIGELLEIEQAKDRRARIASPAALIVPTRTVATGPVGCGNGRELFETLGIILQVRHAAPDAGASARATLRTLRALVWTTLEGARLDVSWAPLRYLGGELLDLGDQDGVVYRWIDYYQTETPTPVRPRA